MGDRHHEPHEGASRRGASLSRRTVAVVSVVVAAVWIAGAALLLHETAARRTAQLDLELVRLESRVASTDSLLRREAALLAQDAAVIEGVRLGDWATLARGAPRLRTLTSDSIADLVVVLGRGAVVIAQVPLTPAVTLPLLRGVTAPTVRLAELGGEPFVLGAAPVDGDATNGLVVVGRRAAQLAPADADSFALFVVADDSLRHSTLAGAPIIGWRAATAAGERSIDGVPWRLRAAGRLGSDLVWVGASAARARAESRRLAAQLAGGFVTLVGLLVAWAGVTGRRRVPVRLRADVRVETLYSAAVAMASGSDLPAAATRALGIVCAAARIDVALLYRADHRGHRLVLLASHGVPPARRAAFETRPLGTSLGEVVRTGRHHATDVGGDEGATDAGLTRQLALPVAVDGVTWGVLALLTRERRVAGDDLVLLQAVVHQIGLALMRDELAAERRTKTRRLDMLTQVAQRLTASVTPDELLQRIVDGARDIVGAKMARLWLLEADGQTLTLRASAGARSGTARLRLGEGLIGRVAAERTPLVLTDILTDPRAVNAGLIRAEGLRGFVGVPLLVSDRLVGGLAVATDHERDFDRDEVDLLQSLANQAAVALDNARLVTDTARLYREATRRVERMSALADVGRFLAGTLEPAPLAERIVQSVVRLFGARAATLFRLDERTGDLESVASAGDHQASAPIVFPAGAGAVGRAAQTRRPVTSSDVLNDPDIVLPPAVRDWIAQEGRRAALGVPLVANGAVVGALSIGDSVGRVFDAEEVQVAQAFADQASLALDNARLYQEARAFAERLRALEEVNRLVSSSLNAGEILANLARAIAQFFEAPYVSVWRVDGTEGRLRRALVHGDAELAAELHDELAVGEGAVGWVVRHRQPILWTDTRTDPRYSDSPPLERRGLNWLTAYPIAIGERIIGAFAVHRPTAWTSTPETESLMGSLAAQAAVALENARMYADTADRLAQTRALLEVAEILNSTLDATQLLKRVAIKIAQVCAVDRCSIELWQGERVVPLMSQFADGRAMPDLWREFRALAVDPLRDIPVNARAIATRRPVIVDDAASTTMVPREWIERFGLKAFMTVPMVSQEQVIGVLTLDYCERELAFEPWQVDLASAVANQLALSLENSRLYAEAQERLRETSTLLAVGRLLSQPDVAQDVMRRVAGEVARAFGADMAGAYLLDERRERLFPVGGYHVPKELIESFLRRPIVLDRFPWLLDAWNTGRAAWSADVLHDPRFDSEWTRVLPQHSVLFVPTMAHGAPVGGLFLVWWRAGRTFTTAEIRLIEGVAAQVGLAMENADLTRQTRAKLAETETLLSASRALSSTLEPQALIRHFLRAVARAIGADCVGSWTVGEDGEWLEPLAGYHIPPERLAAFREFRVSILKHAFYAEAARTCRPVYTTEAMDDTRIPTAIREQGAHRTQLFVPVVAKDRMIAGFAAVWWEQAREFTEGELALMEALANQAGVALENARLFAENRRRVEELSVLHDLSRAVTGQLDRTALIAALRTHVARVLAAENMGVVLHDDARGDLEVALRVAGGVEDLLPPRRFPLHACGLASVVLQQNRAVRTDDYAAACARHGVEPAGVSAGLRHWLGAPMIAGERALGVIIVRDAARAFTEADERLLTNIAHLAALALSSARLYAERTRALAELGAAQDQLVRTEKLRALGEMASGVAHDFNNLLAAILGRAQLLLRRVKDPQPRQWLQVIERSALDGAQTVKRLQDFTRIRRDEPLVPLALDDVAREALEMTQSRWQEEPLSRGVTIEVHRALEPVPRILGDASELREVFTNLILNAVDAMPDGGALMVSTAVADGQVVATIRDTGVGIPDDVRDKVFDPFFTTKGPRGTGLGLSVSYGIVSRHGGRIAVESVEGQGAIFRLSFPPALDQRAVAVRPLSAPTGSTPSLRCLVVDDEPTVRTVLGDILTTAGHEVVESADGADALERLRTERFDLVLTDLAMPRVSGWQVARFARQSVPGVHVVLVTGFGVELSADERRANGVDAVLVKPLQIQDILDAVAEVARRRPPAGLPEER